MALHCIAWKHSKSRVTVHQPVNCSHLLTYLITIHRSPWRMASEVVINAIFQAIFLGLVHTEYLKNHKDSQNTVMFIVNCTTVCMGTIENRCRFNYIPSTLHLSSTSLI